MLAALLLVLVGLPYLLVSIQSPAGFIFNGFLLNPLDGNSYLAKMYLGWRGEWLFTLPYTADVGKGALIYPFYILLGHLSRWMNIPLIVTFHVARLVSSLILFLSLARYLRSIIPDRKTFFLALVVSAFGSGLGWLAIAFGQVISDFWVAEAYPFLSAYTNPHFPLSLAMMLMLLNPSLRLETDPIQLNRLLMIREGWILPTAFILACLSPFGLVMIILVWSGMFIWNSFRQGGFHLTSNLWTPIRRIFLTAMGGGWVVLYQTYMINRDPLFSGWNAQNVTPAPPVWDVILALSPLLLLVPFGLRDFFSKDHLYTQLFIWLVIALCALYFPWNLQRRFMIGIYIPTAALASISLKRLTKGVGSFWRFGFILLVFALPTNLAILMAARYALKTHDEKIFLTRDEVEAMDWISSHTPQDSVFLTSPDTGLFIPARTGRRVIYGHPFETVDAETNKLRVEEFFIGESSLDSIDLLHRVDFIYYGPRERKLGNPDLGSLRVIFKNATVIIYAQKS